MGRCMMLWVVAAKRNGAKRMKDNEPRAHFERSEATETQWSETGKQVVPFAWKVVIGRRNEEMNSCRSHLGHPTLQTKDTGSPMPTEENSQ